MEVIGEDEIGRPFVALGKQGGDGFGSVSCLFTQKDKEELAALKVGEVVTILGRIRDYLLNVIVYDCYTLKYR